MLASLKSAAQHSAPQTETSSSAGQEASQPQTPAGFENFDRLPDSGHVRVRTVAAICDASVPTVWRWSKSGRLPAPKNLGPNLTAWNVGELRRALALGGAK